MSLVQLKRDMDNKLKDRRASLQQEYELKLQRERDKLSKKVGVENLQEMKLQARIDCDDTLRQAKRDAEKNARDKIKEARERYDEDQNKAKAELQKQLNLT